MTTQSKDRGDSSAATEAPRSRPLTKVVLGILAAAIAVIAAVAVVIAMQPDTFHVERTATMAAPPEEVFAQVNDFHKWDAWSPWLDLDPNVKTTFEGPDSGAGAIFRWAGNAEVGEGSMTILESRPHEYVRIELRFIKPFEDTAITEFKLAPTEDGTNVTWSMDGHHNFISKAMCLFVFDMEQMIGDNYDEGLANIKQIVEAESAPAGDADQPGDDSSSTNSQENP